MSFSTSARSLPQRFVLVLTSFLQCSGLAFADVLPQKQIQAAFDAAGVALALTDDDLVTQPVTLWAF